MIRKIKAHALGSFYRLNAGSADCYAFSVDHDGGDWQGGWDWTNDLIHKNAEYIFKFSDNKFYKIN
jgi:hypothetical protein